MRLAGETEESQRLSIIADLKKSGQIKSVSDVFAALNLKITSRATGVASHIDLHASARSTVCDALSHIASATGELIFVLGGEGVWRKIDKNTKAAFSKPRNKGYLEIAVTDRAYRLVSRHSINFWKENGNVLEASSSNAPVKKIVGPYDVSFPLQIIACDTEIQPVDVVYTWVNSDDPAWQELMAPYRGANTVDYDRYKQVDELRYSLRSLFTFAPWVRKVFIFTNCSPPAWFVPSERVLWVMHDEVIPEHYLPLFSSHSIETFIHQIPGLSERYVYFNDDVFLSAPVEPLDFFTPYNQSVSRMEPSGVIHFLQGLVKTGEAEEWQHAAANSAELLLKHTNILPTKLHRHTPHAFLRSVYVKMEQTFTAQMEITRSARFRNETDFSFTSFIYHHYARAAGNAVHIDEEGMIVRSTNYKRFLERKIYTKQRFFCINDGGGSASDPHFRKFKQEFLSTFYCFKSPAE